jgi:hypothetical protein
LFDRLSAGAAVVVTAADPALISDLCTRVVLLQEGRVARFGPAAEVLAEIGSRRTEGDRQSSQAPAESGPESEAPRAGLRGRPQLRSFSEHAAIHSVAVLRPDGSPVEVARNDESVVVRIEFELAARETVLVVVRFVGAQTLTFVEQRDLGEGGYVASLRIPPGAVPTGEYVLPVGLVLEREGDRRKVGRRNAARIRVDGDEEGLALLGETGAALQDDARPETSDADWSFEEVFD